MRTPHYNTAAATCEVSDAACAETIEIQGHDLISSGGKPTGLKTLRMDALALIDYMRVLYALERAAGHERLRWRVRVGAVLLQVRARVPRGAWTRWLAAVKIHVRSAQRAMTTATRLADQYGELSTDKLRECLQLADGVDMPKVSENLVDETLVSRREYAPAAPIRPLAEPAKRVFDQIHAPAYARGSAPVVPVVVDGEQQPGVTFNRRAFGERIEVSAREVQVFTGPSLPNRMGNTTSLSRSVATSFGDSRGERHEKPAQLKFDGMYRAAECVRGALGLLSRLEAVDVPAELRDVVTAESEAFGKRISELCGGLCSGLVS